MKFVRRDPDIGYLDSQLWAPKTRVNIDSLKGVLTFSLESKRGDTRYLKLWEETEHHIVVPRAMWRPEDCDFEIVDCRPATYETVDIRSHLIPDAKNPTKTVQRDAIQAILQADGGILQLACGKGKTCVALHVAAQMRVPTLIVVNNTTLLKQWIGEIAKHLTVPAGVGLIQAGANDWQKPIVLSTYQTLAERADDLPQEIRRWFGFGIYDEGHHTGANWFCRTIDLLYGKRLLLTATPERNDGAHVIYKYHVGNVLYKDLKQDLTPSFEFLWTGMSLPNEAAPMVSDKNGEMHLSKLAGYFGCWKERLEFIIRQVRKHAANGRKTLVLSTSVAELVNLFMLYNQSADAYSNLKDLEDKPVVPSKLARDRWNRELAKLHAELKNPRADDIRKMRIKETILPLVEAKIQASKDASARVLQIQREQKAFIKKAITTPSDAGLLIAKVPVEERMKMLKERKVIFTIYQYGLEGLDDADLDTIIAAEPMTSKNAIQQFVGRVLRLSNNVNKRPVVQFLEDDVGPIIGMCKSIRRQLRQWPIDEGGPYRYSMVGHPYHNK